ncbi:hypothetical protein IFX38_003488 [Escherichia coli]|nr:hypothetical protein [Escherichia coli]
MKRYVKNWYTIFDGFELTNRFMLDKLKLERDSLELGEICSKEIVSELQGNLSK